MGSAALMAAVWTHKMTTHTLIAMGSAALTDTQNDHTHTDSNALMAALMDTQNDHTHTDSNG